MCCTSSNFRIVCSIYIRITRSSSQSQSLTVSFFQCFFCSTGLDTYCQSEQAVGRRSCDSFFRIVSLSFRYNERRSTLAVHDSEIDRCFINARRIDLCNQLFGSISQYCTFCIGCTVKLNTVSSCYCTVCQCNSLILNSIILNYPYQAHAGNRSEFRQFHFCVFRTGLVSGYVQFIIVAHIYYVCAGTLCRNTCIGSVVCFCFSVPSVNHPVACFGVDRRRLSIDTIVARFACFARSTRFTRFTSFARFAVLTYSANTSVMTVDDPVACFFIDSDFHFITFVTLVTLNGFDSAGAVVIPSNDNAVTLLCYVGNVFTSVYFGL